MKWKIELGEHDPETGCYGIYEIHDIDVASENAAKQNATKLAKANKVMGRWIIDRLRRYARTHPKWQAVDETTNPYPFMVGRDWVRYFWIRMVAVNEKRMSVDRFGRAFYITITQVENNNGLDISV